MLSKLLMIATLATAGVTQSEESAGSDREAPESTSRWQVEGSTSPQFFFPMRGYHLALGVRPPGLPRWRFSAISFGLQMPELFLKENAGLGWTVRHWSPITAGASFFVTGGARGGLFVSLYVAPHRNTYARGGESVTLTELAVMPQLGFQWSPFDSNGLFVQAWIGPAISLFRSGAAVADGLAFRHARMSVVPALELGYRF
jgi:hypothetical protein